MKPTFENTTRVLADAWNNGHLINGSCPACAVGNIIASCNNYTVIKYEGYGWHWRDTNGNYIEDYWGVARSDKYGDSINEGIRQIISSGYTWAQLREIEKAFESPNVRYPIDMADVVRQGCMGILAAVNELGRIHNATPFQVEQAKKLFTRE